MFRSTAVVALAAALAGTLAACESTPESPGGVVAGQAVRPDEDTAEARLVGNVWQPIDFTGCAVPWGLPVMVESSGIAQREFRFTTGGLVRVRQVEASRSPDAADTYSFAYSRQGSTLRVRAGLGVDTWTIRELTPSRLHLEDENGNDCWLRRVG